MGIAMEMRIYGRSGLRLSVLGFGCGAVGGLMVRGDPADQERAIARALEAGVNYFDTAVQYGDGQSERNLGRILEKLKPANAVVGTKVRLQPADLGRIGDAIDDLARREPGAAAARSSRHLPSAQCDHRNGRRPGAERRAGARRGRSGVRALRQQGKTVSSASPRSATPLRCIR